MAELAALGIKATVDGVDKATDQLTRLTGAAGKAETATDKLAPSAKNAGDGVKRMGDDAKTAEGSLSRLSGGIGTVVGKLAAMASAALSVGAYIKLADSWSDLRSQLGAAIGDMGAASDMMQRMVDIANASYSPLDQTVQVYARNVGVLRDLGKSAAQAADFTESLNHMLVITATKGERAASVQDALAKAMAVGKLQADGLETILANGGRVAQALADELGTTVSGLRSLASDGKITGQVIADSIIKPLDDVRAVAAEMPATVGDAFTRIGTSLLSVVGTFDQATGASSALAASLIWLADNLPVLADGLVYLGATVLGVAATQIPAMIVSLATSVISFGAAATAAGLMATATTGLATAMAFLGGPIGIAVGAVVAIGAALLISNARTATSAIETSNLNQALKNVPGYANGAAGGINNAGNAADAAAGHFDNMTGAINSSTSAMSAWLTERAKIPGIMPISPGSSLPGPSPDAAGIENFLLDQINVNGGSMSERGSQRGIVHDATRYTRDNPLAAGGGAGGGGGGGGGTDGALSGLISELSTEKELLEVWYQDKMKLIQSYSDQELAIVGGRHGALERLEAEHQDRLRAIGGMAADQRLSDVSSLFGGLASIAEIGGKRQAKLAATLAAVETTVNGYATAMAAARQAPTLAGKFAVYAGWLATTAKAVSAIRSAGGGGGGGGGGVPGGAGAGAAGGGQQSAPEAPLRVTLDTIDPSAAYSGSAMIKMFEAIQKEAGNRGIVWVPAGA